MRLRSGIFHVRFRNRTGNCLWGSLALVAMLALVSSPLCEAARPWLPVARPLGTPLTWQDHELPHVQKQHAVEITSECHQYTIVMGGMVDMDHAMTRDHRAWHIGWQPNESLVIENIGPAPCENSKIIINDRGDWYSMESLLGEVLRTAKTDEEKVYLIWQFVRDKLHWEKPTLPYQGETTHPVKTLMSHGGCMCGNQGAIQSAMFLHAGFPSKRRELRGHSMSEAFVSSRWQFMGTAEDAFYLDLDNERPIGGDDIVRDHYHVQRELIFGPKYRSRADSYGAMAKFGHDDSCRQVKSSMEGYEINVKLRPHERIEYRWDNIGKWAMRKPGTWRHWVGNSRKIYEPSLAARDAGASEVKNISLLKRDGETVVAANDVHGALLYKMESAFVCCGGRVTATFQLDSKTDRAVIEAGQDPKKLTIVWEGSGPGRKDVLVEIDKQIDPYHSPAKRHFFVRVRLISESRPKAAVLSKLAIRSDILVSPIALPRLRLGKNKIVYTDDSASERKVRVTYKWRETEAAAPLSSPHAIYPPDGATVRDAILTYRWKAVDGAVCYHTQVCRDPQMRWPYRPNVDAITQTAVTEWTVPYTGNYAPDTTYYWRLRTKNAKGIWGDWGKVRAFCWAGPRIPVNVRVDQEGGKFILRWEPNTRGERPVAYEVYGSNLKGFVPSKTSYEYPKVDGWVANLPPFKCNYLGRTTTTKMVVAGASAVMQTPVGVKRPENLNRCYYRVVAIDKHGTPSGGSEYVELPHPLIWSEPATTAQVGKAYRYEPKCIRSDGDLQYRAGPPPPCDLWDKEILRFSLVDAPKWLSVDAKSGLLTGTPPAASQGKVSVRLLATPAYHKRAGGDGKYKYATELSKHVTEQCFELTVAP